MPNLFTSPIPHLKTVLLAVILPLLASHTVLAQTSKLTPLSHYQETLRRYHQRKWAVERKEFLIVHKKKWWYYLPNIGWAFGMPTVTLGTSTLAQIDRDNAVHRAKLEGLDARANLEYNEQMEQLNSLYAALELELEVLQDQKVVNMMEGRLLTISEDAYKANQVRPEVYFTEQLKFQKSRLADNAEVRRLRLAIVELERFAHYRLTENELADVSVEEDEEVQPRKKRFWNRKQKP